MLVLNRDIGESVILGDEDQGQPKVQVKVLGIEERGGKQRVRLGFDGPKEVPIHREEVHKKRQAVAAHAAQAAPAVAVGGKTS